MKIDLQTFPFQKYCICVSEIRGGVVSANILPAHPGQGQGPILSLILYIKDQRNN